MSESPYSFKILGEITEGIESKRVPINQLPKDYKGRRFLHAMLIMNPTYFVEEELEPGDADTPIGAIDVLHCAVEKLYDLVLEGVPSVH